MKGIRRTHRHLREVAKEVGGSFATELRMGAANVPALADDAPLETAFGAECTRGDILPISNIVSITFHGFPKIQTTLIQVPARRRSGTSALHLWCPNSPIGSAGAFFMCWLRTAANKRICAEQRATLPFDRAE